MKIRKLINNNLFIFFSVYFIFCNTISNPYPYKETLNSYDCELFRFKNFYIYKSFDKNRICVYSPIKDKVIFKKNNKNMVFGIPTNEVITGLDIAEITKFEFLHDYTFGLLTNATGVNQELDNILEILINNNLKPNLLLEPEHGIFGSEDETFHQSIYLEKKYGITTINLYSTIKKPPVVYIKNLDTIVIDIQNLPVRCYTYISTLTYILEVADLLQKEVIILDRPHPYGIWKPMGHMLQEEYKSFVGEAPVPFLYVLTPGEYCIYMSLYKFKNLKLKIIRMENFSPKSVDWTLSNTWINPSPNIPNLESSLLYTGFVFFEGTNISVGRGTTKPFIYIGAPWLKNDLVLKELKSLNIKGIKMGLVEFKPTYSIYQNQLCKGIQFYITSLDLDPIRLGYELMKIIKKLHKEFEFKKSQNQYYIDKLWGSDSYRNSIEMDLLYEEFKKLWISESQFFEEIIQPIKLYD